MVWLTLAVALRDFASCSKTNVVSRKLLLCWTVVA